MTRYPVRFEVLLARRRRKRLQRLLERQAYYTRFWRGR